MGNRQAEGAVVLDLKPATDALAAVVTGVRDEQLGAPTPCEGLSVADLIDHVDGLSLAFAAAAAKTRLPGDQAPAHDGSRLNGDWRQRIPVRLTALAEAWRDESAWTGMTQAGGVDLPGDVAAAVAIDEVVVHGWDIAMASGQRFSCPEPMLQAAYGFVQASAAENPQGTPGLF